MKSLTVNSRRILIAAVVLFVALPTLLDAQAWGDREARRGLTIGPGFQAGASMIQDSPEGFKIKPTFAFRADVHTTYPLVPTVAVGLGLGYDSRGTLLHVHDNDAISGTVKTAYFSIHPHFVFSGFSLGVNFGLPLGDPATSIGGVPGSGSEQPVMIEPRIEGIIPLVDDETGWASLVIGGGYSLSPLIDIDATDVSGDWHHFSAHLGFRYEFLIPDTQADNDFVTE